MSSTDTNANSVDPDQDQQKKSNILAPKDSCTCTFNDFPTTSDLCRLLITYANSVDPDPDRRGKSYFLNPADANKSMKKNPVGNALKKGT